jgi:hypothetical protein
MLAGCNKYHYLAIQYSPGPKRAKSWRGSIESNVIHLSSELLNKSSTRIALPEKET